MNHWEVNLAEDYCSRAIIKMSEGDVHGAIEEWTTALGLQTDGWTYFFRGQAFLLIHHNDDALKDFQRAQAMGLPVHHDFIDICTRSARTKDDHGIEQSTIS